MIILNTATKTLETLLAGAVTANQLDVNVEYVDITSGTFAVSGVASSDATTNDTTAVTITSAPTVAKSRQIKAIFIYNKDTAAATVTVQINNNSTLRILIKTELQPGDTLQYVDGEGWSVGPRKKLDNLLPSVGNSPAETLAGSGSFTGTWEYNDYNDAQIWVLAAGAATLFIEFSPDGGTTVDQFPFGGITLTPGIPYYDHVVVGGQWFRIRVVDTSTASNALLGIVTYGDFQRPSSIISEGIKGNQGAVNVKSVIFSQLPDGTYSEVKAGDAGELQVANYGMENVRGNLTGKTSVRVSGRNSSVNTTERMLWNGGAAYNFLTSGIAVRVRAGGNANDTAAGSGARQLTVVGLTMAGVEQTSVIDLAGASASSATTELYGRINEFYVSSAGTYATGAAATGSNTGAITLETSGGTLLGLMAVNTGRGGVALFTIPAGKKGYLKRFTAEPEGGKAVTFKLWTRRDFDIVAAPFGPKMLRREWPLVNEEVGFDLEFPIELRAKEEIWVTANTSSGTSAASCAFEIELVDD